MNIVNYTHYLMNMIIHSMQLLTYTTFFKILVFTFAFTWTWKNCTKL